MASGKEKNFIKAWLETDKKRLRRINYDWKDKKIILGNTGAIRHSFESIISFYFVGRRKYKNSSLWSQSYKAGPGISLYHVKFLSQVHSPGTSIIFIKYIS